MNSPLPLQPPRCFRAEDEGAPTGVVVPSNKSGYPLPIDLFRGFVCLEIIAMHFYFAEPHAALSEWLGPGGEWAVQHLRFSSESFFVLAGYFLARGFRPGEWSYLSLRSFLTRRMVRLAVPYWVALLLGVFGWHLREAVSGYPAPESWVSFWPMLFFLQNFVPVTTPNLALWFMAPLFQYYLLWGLLFWVVRWGFLKWGGPGYHNRSLGVVSVITGLVLAASLTNAWVSHPLRSSLELNALYLSLGCFVYWASIQFLPRWCLAVEVAAVAGVGLALGSSRMVSAAVAAVCLLGICKLQRGPVWLWPLGLVGRWSFSIYLTQMYVGPRVLHLAGSRTMTPAVAAGLLFAAIAASIVAGAVFFSVVETPLARQSRKLAYRG